MRVHYLTPSHPAAVGYLISSRKEVDSVVLPYLNRARLSLACRGFLDDGEGGLGVRWSA